MALEPKGPDLYMYVNDSTLGPVGDTTENLYDKLSAFGFPGNSNDIITLNFCILYAKYYIYIHKLSNSNKINFLNFLTYLKQKINIEKQICST